MHTSAISSESVASGWGALFSGKNFARSIVLSGGVAIHAVYIYVVATMLPSIIRDIGGVAYYAWATTLFMVGSIAGSAVAAMTSERFGPRSSYRIAVGLFIVGSTCCAVAPAIPLLIAGRFLQGIGGGLLTALAYSTIRQVFEETLHARAISMVSGVWGVAALLGPLAGGTFAEHIHWRGAFWFAIPVCLMFLTISEGALPKHSKLSTVASIPWFRLVLLALAALSISAGSVPGTIKASFFGIGIAAGLLWLLLKNDSTAKSRLLPTGAFRPSTPLGAMSSAMGLLAFASAAIGFLPFILVTVFNISSLTAGYIIALEAFAWTTAALLTASSKPDSVRILMRHSPVVMAFAAIAITLGLAWRQPLVITVGVMLVGGGIGMGWAHYGNNMISAAQPAERDLAAAFISTTQLIATAFGSAVAGVIVNLAGISSTSSPDAVLNAGVWLFGLFAVAPALAIGIVWRIGKHRT